MILLKKIYISRQFCFEFFLGNTYKFCYEIFFAKNCCQFFYKVFCINHYS